MVKIEAVVRDEDNNVQAGIHFYWDRKTGVVLSQSWEYKASGPIWFEVKQLFPMVHDFLGYFCDNWSRGGYTISDITELG